MADTTSALNSFTPVTAAIGGSLLGLSASMLLHQTGRWSGASSIYRRATTEPLGSWQQTWVAGVMAAVAFARFTGDDSILTQYLGANAVDSSLAEVLLGGLLIGAGTKVGCGCTSGHGVMGIPRGSLRSITATATFMATGVLAATFLRPMLFDDLSPGAGASAVVPEGIGYVFNFALAAAMATSLALDVKRHARAAVTTFACGLTFGFGLLISGMVEAEKIRGFLDISPLIDPTVPGMGSWDPSMIVVMASALTVNLITFNLWLLPKGVDHHEGQDAAIDGHRYSLPCGKTKVTTALVVGSAVFGIGWGLSGICVGPAIANAAKGGITSIIALAAISFGTYLSQFSDPLFG